MFLRKKCKCLSYKSNNVWGRGRDLFALLLEGEEKRGGEITINVNKTKPKKNICSKYSKEDDHKQEVF